MPDAQEPAAARVRTLEVVPELVRLPVEGNAPKAEAVVFTIKAPALSVAPPLKVLFPVKITEPAPFFTSPAGVNVPPMTF